MYDILVLTSASFVFRCGPTTHICSFVITHTRTYIADTFVPMGITFSEDGDMTVDKSGKIDMVLYPHCNDVDDKQKGKRNTREDGVSFTGKITDASETRAGFRKYGFREYMILRNRRTGQMCLERVQSVSKEVKYESKSATKKRPQKMVPGPSIPQDRHHERESTKSDRDEAKPVRVTSEAKPVRVTSEKGEDVAAPAAADATVEKTQAPSGLEKVKEDAIENLMDQVGYDLMNQLTGRSDGWKAMDIV